MLQNMPMRCQCAPRTSHVTRRPNSNVITLVSLLFCLCWSWISEIFVHNTDVGISTAKRADDRALAFCAFCIALHYTPLSLSLEASLIGQLFVIIIRWRFCCAAYYFIHYYILLVVGLHACCCQGQVISSRITT